jgi:hypothetical protein
MLYTLDPTASSPSLKVAYAFPDVTCTAGIAESHTPDVFLVITGNYSVMHFSGTRDTFSIWSLDFREDPPIGKKIAPVPDTDNLIGLTVIDGFVDTVMVADAGNNALRSVNTRTGQSRIELQHDMFVNTSFPLGINGIEVFGQHLYFTNSAQGIYGKVRILHSGRPFGEVEQIASLGSEEGRYDDFTMDRRGNGLLAVKPSAVNIVTSQRDQSVLSHGPFSGPTSLLFGRGSQEQKATLYVTTCGPMNTVGGEGQVMAIDDYQPHLEVSGSCWSFEGMKKAMALLWRQQPAL